MMLSRIFLRQGMLLLPLVIFYGALALLPVVAIFQLSLEKGVEPYIKLFSSSLFMPVLRNTLYIGLQTTLFAVALGYLVAALLWRSNGIGRIVILGFVLLPFWTGVLIKNFAWAALLQDNGSVNQFLLWSGLIDAPLPLLHNRFAVLVGMVHYTLPYAVFPIFTAMLVIDHRLERAARSLGASTRSVVWLVIAPLTLPGVYAAALLVFIISIGFYITPVVLGSPREMMVANLVQFYAQTLIDFNVAAALSVLILIAAGLLIAVYQFLPKEGQFGKV